MNKSRYSKGFTVVEILLAIVLILLIIGTGWYIYRLRHNKNNLTSTQNKQSEKSNNNSNTTNSTPASPTYLFVKEAKIKFQLSPNISDAYYYSDPNDSSGLTTSFSTHTLDKLGIATCKIQQVPGANAGIYSGAATLNFDVYDADRIARGDKPENSSFKNEPNAVRLGNTWYEISAYPNCKSNDAAIQAKIKSIQDSFVSASKTITSL